MEVSTKIAGKKILIMGATSAIAEAVACWFAKEKYDFYLLARNQKKLANTKKKLAYHGADSITTYPFYAENLPQIKKTLKDIFRQTSIDVVFIAHGVFPNQNKVDDSEQILFDTLQVNSISTLYILEFLAKKMQKGTIGVLTSLTVENSNRNNYIYACSKALVANYLKGFAYKLQKKNIKVLDIRPALVKTPMTKHLQKKNAISPDYIAKDIFIAICKGNKRVVYTPHYWRFIMFVLRNIPEKLFYLFYFLYNFRYKSKK